MKKIVLKEHPVLLSYCLSVCNRFRMVGTFEHTLSKYNDKISYGKRQVALVQSMENNRRRTHKESLRILSVHGYNLKQASVFLEKEIEKLVNIKLPELRKDEVYCGACRIKIKTKDFDEHSKTEVHKYVSKELEDITKLAFKLKLNKMQGRDTV